MSATKSRRARRILCRLALAAILGLLALLGLVWAVAQTGWAKQKLASALSTELSAKSGNRVRIEGLGGILPSRLSLAHLEVSDDNGPWLTVDRLVLRWSPLTLLKGPLRIDELSAATVHLDRVPASPQEPAGRPTGIPWPMSLPDLAVDQLKVEHFVLGPDLAGREGTFRLHGQILTSAEAPGIELLLMLETPDGSGSILQAQAEIRGKAAVAAVELSWKENANGWVAQRLGLAALCPLAVRITGKGPLSKWEGELAVELGAKVKILSTAQVRASYGFEISLQGKASFGGDLFPGRPTEFLKEGCTFEIGVRAEGGPVISLDRLNLQLGPLRFALRGQFDSEKAGLDVALELACRDLSLLNAWLESDLRGQAELKGHLSGPVTRPKADLKALLTGLGFDGHRVEGMQVSVEIEPKGPLFPKFTGLALSSEGQAAGIAIEGQAKPVEGLSWKSSALIGGDGSVQIERLEARSGGVRLTASGPVWSVEDRSSKLGLRLEIDDLRPLSGSLGLELSGKTTVQANVSGRVHERSLEAEVKGHLAELGYGGSSLRELLGGSLEFGGNLGIREGRECRLEAFECRSPLARLALQTVLDLDQEQIRGTFSLDHAKLSVFTGLAEQKLGGRLSVKGSFSGATTQPKIDLSVSCHQPVLEELRLGALVGDIQFEPLKPLSSSLPTFRIQGKGKLLDPSYEGPGAFPEKALRWSLLAEQGEDQTIALHWFEIQGDKLRLSLSGKVRPNDQTAALSAEIGASDLRPISSFFGMAVPGAMGCSLTATGDWRSLSVEAQIRSSVSLSEALPGPLGALCGREVSGRGALKVKDGHDLSVSGLVIDTGVLELSADGKCDLRSGKMAGKFRAAVPELAPLSGAAGTRLRGKLEADAEFSGTWDRPNVSLDFVLAELEAERARAKRVAGTLQLQFVNSILQSLPEFRFSGKGTFESPAYAKQFSFPDERFAWALRAAGPVDGWLKDLALECNGEHLQLSVSGSLHLTDLTGPLDIKVAIPDLAPFTGPLGQKIGGSAELQAQVRGSLAGRAASADWSARLKRLVGLPHGAGDLLRPEVSGAGTVRIDRKGEVTLTDTRVVTEAFRLSADGTGRPSEQTFRISWQLDVPQLAKLDPVLPVRLAGALTAEGTFARGREGSSLESSAKAKELRVSNRRVGAADVTLSATGAPSDAQGRVELHLVRDSLAFSGAADFRTAPGLLVVPSLSLNGPKTEVNGKVTVLTGPSLAEGELRGALGDLSLYAPLLGVPLAGSASFMARADHVENSQKATLELLGDQIETPLGSAGRVDLEAEAADLWGIPMGRAKVRVRKCQRGDWRLDLGELSLEGSPRQLSLGCRLEADLGSKVTLEARGQFKELRKLSLDHLQCRAGEQKLSNLSPVMIDFLTDGVRWKPCKLSLAGGVAETSGEVRSDGKLLVEAGFQRLPLSLIPARLLPASGHAEGKLRLSGSLESPDAVWETRLSEVLLGSGREEDATRFSLASQGQYRDGLLSVELSMEAKGFERSKLSMRLPLRLSLVPFSASLDRDGDLQGKLVCGADLPRIIEPVFLDGQSVRGALSVDLSVTGKVSSPQVHGSLRLKDGLYENPSCGTVLRDIEVSLIAQGSRLVLERAKATDGGAGSLSGQGWLEFGITEQFPFHCQLGLENAALVRTDEASATVGGQLTLSGNLAHALLAGRLELSPGEWRIPDRLPLEIHELDVQEINGPEATTDARARPTSPSRERLELSLGVSAPGQVFVRGRGLVSEWKGGLEIKGTAARPVITGTLAVVRGHFTFAGRRLSLVKGSLTFDGSVPPAPTLDLMAEATVKEISARLMLTGLLESPKLSLESAPEYPTDEILSRLLFGRSAAQMSPFQALKVAKAVDSLTRGASGFDVAERVRKLLKVDQLELRQSEDRADTTTLGAGKYLTKRVYVDVEKGLGPDRDRVSVEVEVTPKISVDSEVGASGRAGAGVNWKWDY